MLRADGQTIPVVCLVVEGGRWTLEAVRNSVKNDVPVVIVQVEKSFSYP